ncbi:MAG: hypothetical protein ACPLZB_05200 [Caldisericaceae bacterium]
MDEALIERFKALEPFSISIINNPWQEGVIDVFEINKTSFDSVIGRLKSIKENGRSEIFVLQGEPGSGKSHLLWRIAKNAEKEFFLFASFNPLVVNRELTYVSILQSVVESLLKKHSELKTKPIDHIIGEIIYSGLVNFDNFKPKVNSIILSAIQEKKHKKLPYVYKEEFAHFPEQDINKLIPVITENAFSELHSNNYIPKRYLRGIISGLINPATLDLTIDLLNGEKLSEDELSKLNLANGFIVDDNIAFELLRSFFILSPFPFLISIDQIEHIDVKLPKEGIIKFFEDVIALSNSSSKVLFLLTVQTQTYQKWETFLPEHLKDRLNNKSTLFSISSEEAAEIIKRRIKASWDKLGVTRDDPFFPFEEGFVKEKIKSMKLKAPRMVINAFNAFLNGEVGEEDSLKSALKDYFAKSLYKRDEMQRETSELILTLLPASCLKTANTYTILYYAGNAYSINNSTRSYYWTTKNLLNFLKKKKIQSAQLIRDEVLKISENTETMKLIKKAGIKLKYYSKDTGKEFIALSKMLKDCESGDLLIERDRLNALAIEKLNNLLEINEAEKEYYSEKTPNKQVEEASSHRNIAHKDEENAKVEKTVEAILNYMKRGKKIINLNTYLEDKSETRLINAVTEELQKIDTVKVMTREDGIVWLSERVS